MADQTIHVLRAGFLLCGFQLRQVPRDWPPGHTWTHLENINEYEPNDPRLCPECFGHEVVREMSINLQLTSDEQVILKRNLIFLLGQLDDYHKTFKGYDPPEIEDEIKVILSILDRL